MASPTTFVLHEVGPGVHAAVSPGTAGPAVSNAAIIDLGDKTVVVDSFQTLRAADELEAATLELTGRRPFLVVNTHWHSDHVGGNQVFADAPIVGTPQMLDLIIADTPADLAAYDAQVDGMRRWVDSLAGETTAPEDRARVEGLQEMLDALVEQRDRYRPALPDVLIDRRLEIVGADRSIEILSYGSGHTDSDVFVHLPADGVVIAGDLVWVGIHPKTDDGHPGPWYESVSRIAELDAGTVVPGHGVPGTGADIKVMRRYLAELAGMVDAVRNGDLDPSSAPPPEAGRDWAGLGRFRQGLERLGADG